MAKPAPKTALRKAPAAAHPVAPTLVAGSIRQTTDTTDAGCGLDSAGRTDAPTTVAGPPPATPPAPKAAPLTMFSVRMDPALRRRVKQYAAGSDLSLQDVTSAALAEYLERNGG